MTHLINYDSYNRSKVWPTLIGHQFFSLLIWSMPNLRKYSKKKSLLIYTNAKFIKYRKKRKKKLLVYANIACN